MAISAANTAYVPGQARTDYRAMSVATVLFFMWGFLTALNDILIPHLKSIFSLSNAQAALIQTAFFGAYFVFAMPCGKLVEYRGYKQTMVLGLLVAAAGALLFIPAAHLVSYPLFLGALVVLAAGITGLQVAANPYVASIGPAGTAGSRLNLSQAFNSLGTTIAPRLGGLLILGAAAELTAAQFQALAPAARQVYQARQAATVTVPYLVIAGILLVLAAALATIRLERRQNLTVDYRPIAGFAGSIWQEKWLLLGAVCIFLYVGAEVSIGSFLINYFEQPEIGGLSAQAAASYVAYYWGGAMVGRFIGSAILTRVRSGTLLGVFATVAVLLVLLSMFSSGGIAMGSILAVGLWNSIMFPSIFTLGIAGLGDRTSKGSSLMVQAIVGGAVVPWMYGKLADRIGYQRAFVIPVLCYVVIALFGFAAARRSLLTDPRAGASRVETF